MDTKIAFGITLKGFRKSNGITHRDFGTSRTYIGSIEKGHVSPTLEKIDDIAKVVGVHPISLIVQTYLNMDVNHSVEYLISIVKEDLAKYHSDL